MTIQTIIRNIIRVNGLHGARVQSLGLHATGSSDSSCWLGAVTFG